MRPAPWSHPQMAPPTRCQLSLAPCSRGQRMAGSEPQPPRRTAGPDPHGSADPAPPARPLQASQPSRSAQRLARPQGCPAAQTCRSAGSGRGRPSCRLARRSIPTAACEGRGAPQSPAGGGPGAPRSPARCDCRHERRLPSYPCPAGHCGAPGGAPLPSQGGARSWPAPAKSAPGGATRAPAPAERKS